jgi:hypothetical protein
MKKLGGELRERERECVCVSERERGGEKGRESKGDRKMKG